MRVLHVIAEMGAGGAERVVHDLGAAQLADGDEVVVAGAGGFRADDLLGHGAAHVELPLGGRRPLDLTASVLRLRRHLVSHPPDVVHTHNVKATLVHHLAAHLAPRTRRSRPPVVTTVHGLPLDAFRTAARVLGRTSDTVVAVSDDVATRLLAAGLSPGRVVVVPNAAPAPLPASARVAARARVRRELGLDDHTPVVVHVARLAAPKRLDLLLAAWEGIDRQEAVLLVVGDGPQRAEVERRSAPLAGRVRLLGERHDVADLLAAADLAVLASDREGLPMAVLEALAAGVPVVASAVGGLRELPADVLSLVEPGSARALAQGLRHGLDNLGGDRRTHVTRVATGAQWAIEHHSVAAMHRGYRSLYEHPRHQVRHEAGTPRPTSPTSTRCEEDT